MVKNFAIIGVSGYIAPRHLKAIKETGNRLIAATDPHDSVGILDSFSRDIRYFKEIERFDRFLEKLRRGPEDERVHYVSICSPNYLHDAHVRFALRVRANAICEKPLVLNPWNIDGIKEIENETGCRVYNILQLRVHPSLVALKKQIDLEPSGIKHDVVLTYITGRGRWYHVSWKGSVEHSGGLATNIGIHFFDLLIWLFGSVERAEVHHADKIKTAGYLELEKARVRWFLSIDPKDVPESASKANQTTFRSITMDGSEIQFSEGFADLHTKVYADILNGKGFSIDDARPSIVLAQLIREATTTTPAAQNAHPILTNEFVSFISK